MNTITTERPIKLNNRTRQEIEQRSGRDLTDYLVELFKNIIETRGARREELELYYQSMVKFASADRQPEIAEIGLTSLEIALQYYSAEFSEQYYECERQIKVIQSETIEIDNHNRELVSKADSIEAQIAALTKQLADVDKEIAETYIQAEANDRKVEKLRETQDDIRTIQELTMITREKRIHALHHTQTPVQN